MRSNLSSSSYWQLTVRLLGIFTLAWLAVAALAYVYLHEAAHARARVDLDLTITRLVEQSANHPQTLAALVDRLARAEPADDFYLALLDPEGRRVAGRSTLPDRQFVTLRRTVGAEEIVAGYAPDEVDEAVVEAMIVLLVSGLAVVAIGLVAGWAFARRAERRFGILERTLLTASSGNLAARVEPDDRADDVARLGDALNASLERLEKANKALRQAGSDIAHEMRTPLNRAQLRLDKAARAPTIERAAIEEVGDDLMRLANVVDETLAIAALENRGLGEEQRASIELADFFAELVSAYDAVVEDAGGTLDLSLPAHALAVRGDRRLLGRAFANLIENALAYAGPHPHITLFAVDDGEAIRAGVADRGAGIPEEERNRLTQRFTRLDPSRGSKGTGLGLALVKAIAQAHGARLEFTEEAPGLRVALRWDRTAS